MLWSKKIYTRNLIRKKNSCGSKIYGERQRKINRAINVYAALDRSAQEK